MAKKESSEAREFRRRFVEWREGQGLTRLDVMVQTKVSLSTLCDFENGKRLPSFETLVKLQRLMGVPEMAQVPNPPPASPEKQAKAALGAMGVCPESIEALLALAVVASNNGGHRVVTRRTRRQNLGRECARSKTQHTLEYSGFLAPAI